MANHIHISLLDWGKIIDGYIIQFERANISNLYFYFCGIEKEGFTQFVKCKFRNVRKKAVPWHFSNYQICMILGHFTLCWSRNAIHFQAKIPSPGLITYSNNKFQPDEDMEISIRYQGFFFWYRRYFFQIEFEFSWIDIHQVSSCSVAFCTWGNRWVGI